MTELTILIPPIVGATIGYATNCLAIRMLFRPHKAIYLFGKRLPFTPGLIPKGQARLAKKLAETIGDKIITPEALTKELIESPILATSTEEIKKAIRENLPQAAEYISNFEHPRLEAEGPEMVKKLINEHVGKLAGMFLDANKIYASIKEGLLDFLAQEENIEMIANKIDEAIDELTQKASIENAFVKVADHVIKHLDIKSIIESRINEFKPEEAESLILSVIRRELHMVMAMGGVLGFIIGWIPVIVG